MATYPPNASTNSTLFVAVNNLATTLVGALTGSGDNTSGNGIQVSSTTGFPATGFITIDSEAIQYTGISTYSGNPVFTGTTRASDGTSAASHLNGATVSHDVVAAHHNVLKNEIIGIETDLVAAIAVVSGATSIATALAGLQPLVTTGLTLTAPNASTWMLSVDNNGNLNITRQS